jgi:hypothetical protein
MYRDLFEVLVKMFIDPPARKYRGILWQPDHMPGLLHGK